jgi:hypothetical protein
MNCHVTKLGTVLPNNTLTRGGISNERLSHTDNSYLTFKNLSFSLLI